MKSKALAMCLTLTIALTPTLSTASPEQHELAQRCLSALEAGDNTTAKIAAEQIEQWRALFDMPLRRAATKCLSEFHGEPWAYFDALGRFSSEERAKAETEEAKQRADRMAAIETLKTRIRLEMEAARASYDQENAQAVLLGTYEACEQLFESSQQAAMTNELCVSSFRAFGHPDMPTKQAFLTSHLEKRLAGAITEELEKNITPEQLKAICEPENIPACRAMGVWPPRQ